MGSSEHKRTSHAHTASFTDDVTCDGSRYRIALSPGVTQRLCSNQVSKADDPYHQPADALTLPVSPAPPTPGLLLLKAALLSQNLIQHLPSAGHEESHRMSLTGPVTVLVKGLSRAGVGTWSGGHVSTAQLSHLYIENSSSE